MSRLLGLFCTLALCAGCAHVATPQARLDVATPTTTAVVATKPAPKCSARHLRACSRKERLFLHRYLAAVALQRWLAALPKYPHVVGGPWDCMAAAETSSNWAMVGSTYSTGLGVVNDIVYEYGTAQEQRDVFSGAASRDETIAVVGRFTAVHGFGGWGTLTKEKCRL